MPANRNPRMQKSVTGAQAVPDMRVRSPDPGAWDCKGCTETVTLTGTKGRSGAELESRARRRCQRLGHRTDVRGARPAAACACMPLFKKTDSTWSTAEERKECNLLSLKNPTAPEARQKNEKSAICSGSSTKQCMRGLVQRTCGWTLPPSEGAAAGVAPPGSAAPACAQPYTRHPMGHAPLGRTTVVLFHNQRGV